jgi:hypothetical protein
VRSWRSIRQWPTWAKWIGGAVALWWVAGWTLPSFGRVIDESTGKPVQGAYVVRVWNAFGMTMGGGRPSCIALRVARTNAAGEYFISPAWAGVSIRRDPLIQAMRNGVMVYSPGMSLSRGDPGWTETIYLKAADPDREKRLEELYRYFYLNGCGSDSELKRKVLGLYKDLYEEAVNVAPPAKRFETEKGFRMEIEALELGWDEAFDRMQRGERGG